MRPAACRSGRSRSGGFSLIEVLVTLLILGVGILSLAAIQVSSLKSNESALERSQVTILVYSMLDRMRANRATAVAGAYNISKTCTAPNPGTLITNDQKAWIDTLHSKLGNLGTTCGEINCVGSLCTVTVYWDDSRGLSGNSSQTLQVTAQL